MQQVFNVKFWKILGSFRNSFYICTAKIFKRYSMPPRQVAFVVSAIL